MEPRTLCLVRLLFKNLSHRLIRGPLAHNLVLMTLYDGPIGESKPLSSLDSLGVAIAGILQIASQVGHLFSVTGVRAWLHAHSTTIYWMLSIAGAVAWAFIILGVLRRADFLASWLTKWKLLMDILDRL